MTTPKREQILELAKQLYFNDMAKSGINNFNDPEPSELAESGYIQTAKSMFMTSTENKNAQYINSEYPEPFSVNIEQLFEANGLILGSRHTGKSDLAMMICDKAIEHGAVVYVFDPSTDWLARSSIRQYVKAEPHTILEVPNESTIFDISLLSPNQARQIVEQFSKALFEYQVKAENRKQYLIIFEEAHAYFYQNVVKAKASANSVRLLSVGRNVSIACVLVSQFASMLDKFAIKHSVSQIWLGFTKEANDLKYLKSLLGSEVQQLTKLNDGEFLYLTRNSIQKINIEPYEANVSKTEIPQTSHQFIEPLEAKQDSAKATVSFITFLLWLGAVLYAISQLRVF